MKTEEDEAFDELARKQGAWGGGFKAKQAMAADKFIAAEERKVGERYGYVPKLHPSEWMSEPAQEDLLNYGTAWSQDGKRIDPMSVYKEPVCDKDPQDCWNVRCQLGKQCKNLAQPAQEPDWKEQYEYQKRRAEMWIAKYEKDIGPLEKAQPAQEPTGMLHIERLDKWLDASLKKHKQRPWVGLTEEDFSAINQSCLTKLQAATSAESILMERNS